MYLECLSTEKGMYLNIPSKEKMSVSGYPKKRKRNVPENLKYIERNVTLISLDIPSIEKGMSLNIRHMILNTLSTRMDGSCIPKY